MLKVTCDHCGNEVNIEEAVKCEWKEFNDSWFYCVSCDENVFKGGNK
jgi:hypothetical protein